MQFTKAMIDLAKEIRRRAKSEDKPAIKLANPELFDELQKIFTKTDDAVVTALIKELFSLAGDPWAQQLQGDTHTERAILKTYRGQSQLVSRSEPDLPKPVALRSQKMYRGQPVPS